MEDSAMMIRGRSWSKLQFITHGGSAEEIINGTLNVLKGGCRWVQLRMKNFSREDIISVAEILKAECRKNDAVLLIDDEVEIALRLNLDGVHLGLKDMPIDEARKILGENFIIGGTANTVEQAHHHISLGADYLGVGPFRYTTTKQNLSPLLGIEGYKSLMSNTDIITVPVVAIGGIVEADIPEIMSTGVQGIAVSGTILNAKNQVEQTRLLLNKLK